MRVLPPNDNPPFPSQQGVKLGGCSVCGHKNACFQ